MDSMIQVMSLLDSMMQVMSWILDVMDDVDKFNTYYDPDLAQIPMDIKVIITQCTRG